MRLYSNKHRHISDPLSHLLHLWAGPALPHKVAGGTASGGSGYWPWSHLHFPVLQPWDQAGEENPELAAQKFSRWDSVLERNSSWDRISLGKVELKRSRSVLMREQDTGWAQGPYPGNPQAVDGKGATPWTQQEWPERSASVLGSQADKGEYF